MNHAELQDRLIGSGRMAPIPTAQRGIYGPKTQAAVMLAMTDGPDTKLSDADFAHAATLLQVPVARIKAVKAVEASGQGFSADGRPIILFEPHRFSRATKGRFDRIAPSVSYPTWDRSKYPKTQDGRYAQLVQAVGLDVDAGFASASYGLFQILGENYRVCGYDSPFDFAVSQARDERWQLTSFASFLRASPAMLDALRRGDWAEFARRYNGPAYRENHYDVRLAEVERIFS